VVRAMHLDLTGHRVPLTPQRGTRRILVENVDLTARMTSRRNAGWAPIPPGPVHTELAWLAADDPLPAAAMLARSGGPLVAHLKQARRSRVLRRQAQ